MFWCILIPFGVIVGALSEELCNESLVINLPDTAFTASSYYSDPGDEVKYGPAKARGLSSDDSSAATWVSATVNQNQWLQVDLLKPSIVKEISTKGRHVDESTDCCEQWVSSYLVKFSPDGLSWYNANCSTPSQSTIFQGNNDTDTEMRNKLSCPVIARYVRVLPQSWHVGIAMRVDMFGCHIENGLQSTIHQDDLISAPIDLKSATHYPAIVPKDVKSTTHQVKPAPSPIDLVRPTHHVDPIASLADSKITTYKDDTAPSPTIPSSISARDRIPDLNDDHQQTLQSTETSREQNPAATPQVYTINMFPWTKANERDSGLVKPKPIWYTTLFAEVPPTESTSSHKRYARSTSQNPWDARDSGPEPGKGGRMIRLDNSPYPIIVYPISETDTYVPQGKRIHGPTEYVPRAFIPKEYLNGDYPQLTVDNVPSGNRNTDQVPKANQWTPVNNPQAPVTNNQGISGGANWQIPGSNVPTPSRSTWELSGGLSNPKPTGNNNWYPAGSPAPQDRETSWDLSGGVAYPSPTSSNNWGNPSGNLSPTSSTNWENPSGNPSPTSSSNSRNPSGQPSDLPQSGGTANWRLSEGPYPGNANLNSGSNWNQPQGPSNHQNTDSNNWNTPPSSSIHSIDKVTWKLSGAQIDNWDSSSVQRGSYRNTWSPGATPNSGNINWGPVGPSNPQDNGGQSWALSNVPNSQRISTGDEWNGRFQEGVIAPKANDRCIESCYDRPDGDYQSCRSCRVYISCSNGNTFANRECPGTLVWNDHQKLCDWTSSSCP